MHEPTLRSGPSAASAPPTVLVMMDPGVRRVALPAELLARLRGLATTVEADGLPAADVLGRADLLLTGWGCPRIDARVLESAPRLQAIVHAAGSVKQLVAREAWERGIVVSSAAIANAEPVAAYTLSMIHLAAKRAFRLAASYRRGTHQNLTTDPRLGIRGRTIGIVGASRIGRLVLRGLVGFGGLVSFDGRVLLSDPYLAEEQAAELGAELVDLDELLARSDIVSLHAPLLPRTRHLLDRRRLDLLRPGAVLINTARGGLIDQDALLEVCRTGRIDAVLDVTDPEPLPPAHPLLGLDNVLVTPHIAGAMGSEVASLGAFAIDEIERFLHGRPLRGAVTADQLDTIA